MPKKKPKTKANKKSKFTQYVSKNRYNILISSLLMLIALGFLLQPFYRDWENARFIKGLARDFPALVTEIEGVTGLDLEIKSNCSQTTEKFTNGVKTCEVSVVDNNNNQEEYEKAFLIMLNSEKFEKGEVYDNGLGYDFKYMNKNSCSFRTSESIYSTCITVVRDANTQLAIEEFSNITNQ